MLQCKIRFVGFRLGINLLISAPGLSKKSFKPDGPSDETV